MKAQSHESIKYKSRNKTSLFIYKFKFKKDKFGGCALKVVNTEKSPRKKVYYFSINGSILEIDFYKDIIL